MNQIIYTISHYMLVVIIATGGIWAAYNTARDIIRGE